MDTAWVAVAVEYAQSVVTADAGGGCGRREHLAVIVEADVVVAVKDASNSELVVIWTKFRDNRSRYGYDKSKKKCVEFFYNGNGGNHNRFKYKHECIKTCIAKDGDDESGWSGRSGDVGKPKPEDKTATEARKHNTITDVTRGKHQKSKDKGDRDGPIIKKEVEDSKNNVKDKKKKEHKDRPSNRKKIKNSKNNGKDKKKKGHKDRPCKKKKIGDSKNNGKDKKKKGHKDRPCKKKEIGDSKNNGKDKKKKKEHKDRLSNKKEIEDSKNNGKDKKKRKEPTDPPREGKNGDDKEAKKEIEMETAKEKVKMETLENELKMEQAR
ncbi:Kunitz/Bovine pancreatic trypsin inhibitor domain protein [Ancylostoma caninum]|uniref:Kunitz/Bovine pancreatic trypsin inhibitor domain protein n=1 Tax=Ancylostoma caninum TaxID=29170 RepID=A0A368GIZ1_ANCCA|nr:Kunitz/Bovine pancreatic trypsin inhibitor domain protein [Ancylostoma caninum]